MKSKWVRNGIIALGAILLIALLNYEISNRNSLSHWNLPLSGRVVVIDPGHGSPDGGAESGEIMEKDIALKVAEDLRNYLQESGALVLMTRENDGDLADKGKRGLSLRKTQDLKRRVEFINDAKADCVISLHLNAIPSSQWRGAQTFYHPKSEKNQILAKFIQDSLRKQLENTNRYAKAIEHVYILKKANAPASLVEVGFLSNPSEKALLQTSDYQDKVAASIYQGVMRYFTNEEVPSS